MNVAPLTSSREAGTSPAARRSPIRRPSLSHVLIALAVILAFVFNFLALQDRSDKRLVAVAATQLVAGSPISGRDIRFVPIDADFEGLEGLVTEDSWVDIEGWLITRSVAVGVPIDHSSLTKPIGDEGLRAMSVPVPIEHAAGGLLEVGDVVDVISVVDGEPGYVASGLTVVSLAGEDSSGLGGFGSYHLVLAVTPDEALLLAAAIDAGSLEIVRATAAGPISSEASDGS